MLRAILVTSLLAFAAAELGGCVCTDVGCGGTIGVTFSEPAFEYEPWATEGDSEPSFTGEMRFGEGTIAFNCDGGLLAIVTEGAAFNGWTGSSCSPWGFTVFGPSAPKAMEISVNAVLWSKSFDSLKARSSRVDHPNGRYCDGTCRSSSFTL